MQYSYQKLDEQISQDVSNSVYLWKKLWMFQDPFLSTIQ